MVFHIFIEISLNAVISVWNLVRQCIHPTFERCNLGWKGPPSRDCGIAVDLRNVLDAGDEVEIILRFDCF